MKMKYFSLVLLFIFLVSCSKNTDSSSIDDANDQVSAKELSYQTVPLLEIDFKETLSVTGKVDVPPKHRSVVSPFKPGYIARTPLLEGDKVVKGQFLVSLQHTDYIELQQNYLKIFEQLSFLKEESDRKEKLYQEDITSKKEYLKAKSNYKSSLANVEGLKQTLQMLNINPKNVEEGKIASAINILAPIDGYVSKVNVSQGSYVNSDDVIMEIINLEHIHLELSVFEKDIMKVKEGQPIAFTLPEASQDVYSAKVHRIGTAIDDTNRRVEVHAHVESTANFMVGMYVDADILVDDKTGYGLPNSAIQSDADGSYVLVIDEKNKDVDKATKLYLTLGIQNDVYTEILNVEDFKTKTIVVLD